jgi:RNA-directed DNA polymerase
MIKASISLQDLRRRLYVKAKAETSWRFWGLYVHVCKLETLRAAYALAKDNDGAPGVDGVTFAAIEAQGVEAFLEQIRDELVRRTYVPLRLGSGRSQRMAAKSASSRSPRYATEWCRGRSS